MDKQEPTYINLLDGPEPIGYGALNLEILVARRNEPAQVNRIIRKLLNTTTSGLVFADGSKEGAVHDALEHVGHLMTRQKVSMHLASLSDLRANFIPALADRIMMDQGSKQLQEHGQVLQNDIEDNLGLLSPIFNLSSGFNIDIVRMSLQKPEWHVDLRVSGVAVENFVRAVRCAHENGTWIALKDYTSTTLTAGEDNRLSASYTVRRHAQGSSGLYVVKGNAVHSPSVPTDGKPRTIYTITPNILLDRNFTG